MCPLTGSLHDFGSDYAHDCSNGYIDSSCEQRGHRFRFERNEEGKDIEDHTGSVDTKHNLPIGSLDGCGYKII